MKITGALFAREFERTCKECGYSWLVPRAVARRTWRGISATSVDGASRAGMSAGTSAGLSAGIEAHAEEMESYRICAKCGADDFTQRAVPRDGGAH
jgi:predicted nucleic-acid-binding Zn-ribbon protein